MGGEAPPNNDAPAKSKAELRAERRAIQEKQRAEKTAKLAAQGKIPPTKAPQNTENKPQQKNTTKAEVKKPEEIKKVAEVKTSQNKAKEQSNENVVRLFSHLPQYKEELFEKYPENVPTEIVKLGLKLKTWTISGSNARCVAMLTAFKSVISNYKTPEGKSLRRDLEPYLTPSIDFLENCRIPSLSMKNAINWLKDKIANSPEMIEDEAKKYLLGEIDSYITERIVVAQFIADVGITKIVDGDVVLTYASSNSVEKTLKVAHDQKIKFRVVIVDSHPTLDGRNLLHRLASYGLECCYIMYNGVSFIMTEVTKVFVGAYAMLSNGNLLSRVGTAGVCMMANRFNIPVLVCCETYKFVDRGLLDSICYNELGNPEELNEGFPGDWRNNPHLKLLNITYDLTPSEFLQGIITEVGLIPPTSVPVILREQNSISEKSSPAIIM